jgi:RNA polymerase sigma-70 factor (ECF subfamily)
MEHPTPRELVERAQRRDAAAFARLIALHERAALAVAFAILGDASAAGDVVQEAFIRVWQRLVDLKDAQKFNAWLTQLVRNTALDHRRRRQLNSFDPDHPEPSIVNDPGSAMEQDETSRQIESALRQLDETTRTIVTLRYYENLSSREIGERLNLSPAAVDMRLSRGRAALREQLLAMNARTLS